jgi:hypothetical protein
VENEAGLDQRFEVGRRLHMAGNQSRDGNGDRDTEAVFQKKPFHHCLKECSVCCEAARQASWSGKLARFQPLSKENRPALD